MAHFELDEIDFCVSLLDQKLNVGAAILCALQSWGIPYVHTGLNPSQYAEVQCY